MESRQYPHAAKMATAMISKQVTHVIMVDTNKTRRLFRLNSPFIPARSGKKVTRTEKCRESAGKIPAKNTGTKRRKKKKIHMFDGYKKRGI